MLITFFASVTIDTNECDTPTPRGAYDLLSLQLGACDPQIVGYAIDRYEIDDGPTRTTDALSACAACDPDPARDVPPSGGHSCGAFPVEWEIDAPRDELPAPLRAANDTTILDAVRIVVAYYACLPDDVTTRIAPDARTIEVYVRGEEARCPLIVAQRVA